MTGLLSFEVLMSKSSSSSSERRFFLTRFNAGAASLAALAVGGIALGQGKQAPATRWQPTRHDKDDWMDELPGVHRLVLDTTTPEGFSNALLFTSNYILANANGYSVDSKNLAIIIVARHRSTAFGYTDSIWAKYGEPIGSRSQFVDPRTKEAAKTNLYAARMKGLADQGVQFAICSMATQNIADLIAPEVKGNAAAINTELTGSLVGNARLVPAGIVGVQRAQERGFALVSC
jgi:intracellular sulfur oxidation DsrE/DsrF family protein